MLHAVCCGCVYILELGVCMLETFAGRVRGTKICTARSHTTAHVRLQGKAAVWLKDNLHLDWLRTHTTQLQTVCELFPHTLAPPFDDVVIRKVLWRQTDGEVL